jgi:tetratricopeptide (TPR) repeat protein
MGGKNLEAIRMGEEVMFALDRNQSRLSDYKVFQINLAYNLGQILQDEKRYQEALLYAKKAEEISILSTEQFLLPEIEYEIAQILSKMGKTQESRTRIEALIPYMRLIGKSQMADLAQKFLDENLTNDVN